MNNKSKSNKEWSLQFDGIPNLTIDVLDYLRGYMSGNKSSKYKVTLNIELEEDYLQGDVVKVDFGQGLESENIGIKRALIVSNNKGNKFSPTLQILPISKNKNKDILETNKLTTIDKSRVIKKVGEYTDLQIEHSSFDVIIKEVVFTLGYDSEYVNLPKYKNKKYKRGDVVFLDLGKRVGSEQKGLRPALLIQNDILTYYDDTVIIAPLTNTNKKKFPTHYNIKSPLESYNDYSTVLFEQIREIKVDKIMGKIGYIELDDDEEIKNIINSILFAKYI